MFADVNLFYRGKYPDKRDIKRLEARLNMKFVKKNFIPITENPYSFQIKQQAGIICLGNPTLSRANTLYCSTIGTELPVTFPWALHLAKGNHCISCEKGDYIIITFSRPSIFSLLSFWLRKMASFIKKQFSK